MWPTHITNIDEKETYDYNDLVNAYLCYNFTLVLAEKKANRFTLHTSRVNDWTATGI